MIQQYLIHESISGNDAFSVYRCVNMHMNIHMCAIRGIQYMWVYMCMKESVLYRKSSSTDIGAHKHCGFKPPLPGFIHLMYIISITSVLYSSPLYMICHLAIKIISLSLSNSVYFEKTLWHHIIYQHFLVWHWVSIDKGTTSIVWKAAEKVAITVLPRPLIHRGRDKMADIFPTTFSNVFSSVKMFEFRLEFNWNLFLSFQAIIWTNND